MGGPRKSEVEKEYGEHPVLLEVSFSHSGEHMVCRSSAHSVGQCGHGDNGDTGAAGSLLCGSQNSLHRRQERDASKCGLRITELSTVALVQSQAQGAGDVSTIYDLV